MQARPSHSLPVHRTDSLALDQPLRWLSLGWRDLRRAPRVGLAYGAMVTLMGWLTFALGNHPYFIAAAVSGFLLVGPIFGAGLIQSSRLLESGKHPTFENSLSGLDPGRAALTRLALVLLAIAVAWLLVSTTLLVAAIGPIAPTAAQALWDGTLRYLSGSQLLAWLAIGGVLAVLCFCLSVIAVPLILDRQASAGDAMRGSLRAVSRHPGACAAWAVLIGLLTMLGFATALIGFVVIYPLLGFASWHAYRALQR
jgi:uncharacterized membrane protein